MTNNLIDELYDDELLATHCVPENEGLAHIQWSQSYEYR